MILSIHRAEQAVNRIFAEVCTSKDLTPRRAILLTTVSALPAPSQTALSAAASMDRSTTAAMVRDAEKRGWLKRIRRKADARTYEVTVTAKGQKLLAPAAKALEETASRLLSEQPKLKALA